MGETLHDSAALLSEAVINHARILTEDPDNPPAVIQAAEQLREAARRYVQVVLDVTGWGNPLHDLLGLEGSAANEVQPSQQSEGDNVEITAKYKVRVRDPERAMALARQGIDDGTSVSDNDVRESDHPVDIVSALFGVDGWDPAKYGADVLSVVEATWEASPTD